KRRPSVGADKNATIPRTALPPERAVYTVPEFCFRNHISRPTYIRLRAEGRGPAEMRVGINLIRITADAERDWQLQMQESQPDIETRATARAVKAGAAAIKSARHVSKRGIAKRAARAQRKAQAREQLLNRRRT